jgi:hypothetical protein
MGNGERKNPGDVGLVGVYMVVKVRGCGVTGGQPHVYVTTTISLAEFTFMKKGQQVAEVVGKGRFSLVDSPPQNLKMDLRSPF